MKKWIPFLAVLPLAAVMAQAQESRQDASVSYSALFSPTKFGNANKQSATVGDIGLVASYRYLLTPRGAAEVNYGYNRFDARFLPSSGVNYRAHTQLQEFSAEYVYSAFSFHNFFPFVEGGIGGYFFGIINDRKTTINQSFKSTTAIGVPYGGGVAYELSPSFDIRLQYRGIIVKTPSMGSNFGVGRYENISNPVVGVAYHF